MVTIRQRLGDSHARDRAIAAGTFLAWLGLGLTQALAGGARAPSTEYYSTAEPPRDFRGPLPTWLAMGDLEPSKLPEDRALESLKNATEPPKNVEEAPRVASTAGNALKLPEAARAPARASLASTTEPVTAQPVAEHPVVQAKKAILACQERYRQVQDYTCTFIKRERIDGRLLPAHQMQMKARSQPLSIYFKFHTPNKGREAIYVAGRHGGKVLAHDVGFGKFLAGTLKLDPKGSMAMEDNRHPVTEAGIGGLIDTVAKHWAVELTPEESVIRFQHNLQIDGRPCTMIESTHPRRHPGFLYYTVKLYIDHELGLPVRFEAYDWPKHPGGTPELAEEYTYLKLRTNVGLGDRDFDAANPQYAFGRF
ncbi:MAG: DUF1571 domain-containing protein [Isosphaeraceae bacterium]|nr:DUF1571 domain-containing protein [Isosphaeraceae bacterium]